MFFTGGTKLMLTKPQQNISVCVCVCKNKYHKYQSIFMCGHTRNYYIIQRKDPCWRAEYQCVFAFRSLVMPLENVRIFSTSAVPHTHTYICCYTRPAPTRGAILAPARASDMLHPTRHIWLRLRDISRMVLGECRQYNEPLRPLCL